MKKKKPILNKKLKGSKKIADHELDGISGGKMVLQQPKMVIPTIKKPLP